MLSCAAAAQTSQPVERVERLVLQLLKDGDVPGVSIALVRDGALVWHRGLGVMNARTGEPVTDDTVFEAASLGKPVFAYAVMKLVDAGKLDLDTPLTRYLPGPYEVGTDPRLDQITARRVLSHTTGFPNWRSGDLRIFFTPGERFSYSGEGYVYLGKAVERVTGEPIDTFLARTVFEPLGMTRSSYAWRDGYKASKTFYHNTRGEPSFRGDGPATGNVAASLHTTASDYGRFLVAVLNGAGLKPQTHDRMVTPIASPLEGGATTINRPHAKPFPDIKWALGWGVQTTAEGPSLFHWGNNGDAKAYVAARLQDKSAVVVFANGVHGLSIVPEILAAAIGGAQPGVAWLDIESYRSPPRQFFRSLVARGATPTLAEYRQTRKAGGNSIDEDRMNRFGLDLLRMGRIADAIQVLEQNVADHPQSFNVYDSLGEAYAVRGDRELAIRNYERSIEINPNNKDGIEALRKLKEKK